MKTISFFLILLLSLNLVLATEYAGKISTDPSFEHQGETVTEPITITQADTTSGSSNGGNSGSTSKGITSSTIVVSNSSEEQNLLITDKINTKDDGEESEVKVFIKSLVNKDDSSLKQNSFINMITGAAIGISDGNYLGFTILLVAILAIGYLLGRMRKKR